MATTQEYISYVCGQITFFDDVRYRKMFGEYMVYINDKPILLVCDNTTYIKKLDCIKEDMKDASSDFPYEGAKEHYILNTDDFDLMYKVLKKVEEVTPVPVKKVRKKTR